MAAILAVGIAALDIVSEVDRFPLEDTEVRACAQDFRRGGNATNSLVVLGQLGHTCEWAGVWTDGQGAAPVIDDLDRHGIGMRHARQLPQGRMPVSCITLNRANGSRTIVHYRDLPEYDAASFARIPLQGFDWIHFEGRNVDDTRLMMQRVRDEAPALPVSLEVEKPRAGIECLFPLAGLILFSRDIARRRGLSAEALLQQVRAQAPGAELVCTLGADGAVGLARDGTCCRCATVRPERVIDTIGAGDTFNAGVIDARLRGASLSQALPFAAELAGRKCGQSGFDGLRVPDRTWIVPGE